MLSSSLKEIHTKNASALSFEELYRNAYRIVLQSQGEELHNRVKDLEREWLENHVQKRVAASVTPILLLAQDPVDAQDQSTERRGAGEIFLGLLKKAWEDHQLCMGMITDVLMYMVLFTFVPFLVLLIADSRLGPCCFYRVSKAFHIRGVHGLVSRLRIALSCASRHDDNDCRCAQVNGALHDPAGQGGTCDRAAVDTTLHVHARRTI